ncbi:MAG: DUF4111 domain-containing protein [Anaerolineae bacterium]|nr:DUF4111 domain-containing protein [Anaerolineae bacterium]NUQ06451.1 DUF4111 domain-containing protein [Anaerolineae bacterium]
MLEPTAFSEVNRLLDPLREGVQGILGDHLVGIYLTGSLATGDFNADSDVDVLIVTEQTLSEAAFLALQVLHECLIASGEPFAAEIEASYIPRAALRRHDPGDSYHPRIERGPAERLTWVEHHTDWVVHRWVAREYGVIVTGPPPKTLIDPVSPEDLRQGVSELIRFWWEPMIDHPAQLEHLGYRAYAAVTMCRMIYTLHTGAVASKPAAVRWVIARGGEHLSDRLNCWSDLLERALVYQLRADDLDTVLDLMRLTVEEAARLA